MTMDYSNNVTKLIEFIEKLDVHPCLGLRCDGHCIKKCAAGGGHNTKLINFYKNKLIEIVQNYYNTTKKAYETGLSSAEEGVDINGLKKSFDIATIHLNNILKLYNV